MKRLATGAALLIAVLGPVVASAPAQACTPYPEGFVLAYPRVRAMPHWGFRVGARSASYVADEGGDFDVLGVGEWKLQIKHGDRVTTIVGHRGGPSYGLTDGRGIAGLRMPPSVVRGDLVTGWVYGPASALSAGDYPSSATNGPGLPSC